MHFVHLSSSLSQRPSTELWNERGRNKFPEDIHYPDWCIDFSRHLQKEPIYNSWKKWHGALTHPIPVGLICLHHSDFHSQIDSSHNLLDNVQHDAVYVRHFSMCLFGRKTSLVSDHVHACVLLWHRPHDFWRRLDSEWGWWIQWLPKRYRPYGLCHHALLLRCSAHPPHKVASLFRHTVLPRNGRIHSQLNLAPSWERSGEAVFQVWRCKTVDWSV